MLHRIYLVACLTAAFVAVEIAAASPASAQTRALADYRSCQVQNEADFRREVQAITLAALETGLKRIDFSALVVSQWRKGNLDEVIEKQVDIAVAQVKSEASWYELIQSLGNKDKAQELATNVAERVYRSDAFKKALEDQIGEIGKEIAREIELATADAAEPAALCMRAFVGQRYGATVARVVGEDTRQGFSVDANSGKANVSNTQIAIESKDAIAGVVILIVRRQLANMARRIGQRVVGAVLSRVVSAAATGIGLVLIAKDVWELKSGVLPIIASEMKSKGTRDKVQVEIAAAIKDQLGEHMREIAGQAADRIVDIWHDYRKAHAKVLELSEKHPKFKAFLEGVKPEQLARVDQIVAVVLSAEGEEGVLRRLDDGSMQRAVERLPDAGIEIARVKGSLAEAVDWLEVSGPNLAKVLDLEIWKKNKAADFTRASLARLIALDDRLAITRIAGLSKDVRDALFELPDNDLKSLGRRLDTGELDGLSRYLSGLRKSAGERVLRAVARDPAKMAVLARAPVRDAILKSVDQDAAVDIMVRNDGPADLLAIQHDFRLLYDGKVSPWLIWEKHPWPLAIIGIVGVILLRMVWRLFTPRRRRAA